ncbi:hypothetical protein VR46_12380 [Streptomyces sp. NRRL S-444]|nr:hypothetical protein VR46_12380 [Streptomyces sp. NRRL S-444]
MSYREIGDAAKERDACLPRSTVSDLLGKADKRAGKECTGLLAHLVAVLLANTAQDHPSAAPWRDRAAWQRRWEALDDRDRADATPPKATGTEGLFGWDGALAKPGRGGDTEVAWLGDRRTSRMAAVISELAALGMYRQACDVAWELQRCVEGTRGPQDPGSLPVRHVVAFWTGAAGDPYTARELTARLLADCREALGEEHPFSRLAVLRLAAWTAAAGDPAEGRRLYRELTRDGSDDRIALLARLGGARAALRVGEADEAGDQLSRLLPDLVAEYGEHHPVVMGARITETNSYWRDTRCAACSRVRLEDLVADATDRLGGAHPLTLRARALHARLVFADGDRRLALELAEEAYRESVRVRGADHPDSLYAGNILGLTLAAADVLAATEMLRSLHERAGKALGPEHHRTLAIGHNLAVVTHHSDPRTARLLYEEVRDARIRVLGAEHPHTLLTRLALAYAVLGLDGPDAARPLIEEVHRARVRVFGSGHPDVERTQKLLRIAAQPPPALPAGGPSER